MSLGRLGGVAALLYAGHTVGDHLIQADSDATTKGEPDREGQLACARHVATYTATQAAFLTLGTLAAGERLSFRRVAAGLAFSAITHYGADRRQFGILPYLARWTRKEAFYELGDPKASPCGTGGYAIDQAFHTGCLAISAAIIAGGRRD